MPLLPIFLDLRDRPVLLAGAGRAALQKAGPLLDAGARLRVVAPAALPQFRQWAEESKLTLRTRAVEACDLDGCVLAIAATNSPAANCDLYRQANLRGILANSVDDPAHCGFFFSSNLRRGPLQIAVSTEGESPAFSQQLRDRIDEQLPIELGASLRELGHQRRRILQTQPSGPERTALLKRMAENALRGTRSPFFASETTTHATREKTSPAAGTVYLVGAGPGDPDLLTIKALRLLQSADVILHDDLVSPEILALADSGAELVPVGKRCGAKSVTQEEIHALMIGFARQCKSVLRLKSGDPMLFGRAAEEIAALAAAEIPCEIIPGITAAFAAAATSGCSLTSRHAASSLLLTTGHRAPQHTQSSPPTRVVYMPGTDWAALAAKLRQEGLLPDLPCAVVSRASRTDERVVFTTLRALDTLVALPAPSVLLVGEIAVPRNLETALAGNANTDERNGRFDKSPESL